MNKWEKDLAFSPNTDLWKEIYTLVEYDDLPDLLTFPQWLLGIGWSTTLALARCGAEVTAVTHTKADLDSLVQECPSIKPVCVDLSDWDATERVLGDVGPVDLLVNNAAFAKLQPFLEVTPDQFDMSFIVNVKDTLHVAQVRKNKMMARGSGGSIVNISSQAQQSALKDHALHFLSCSLESMNVIIVPCEGATKGTMDMLTKVMALDLGPYQIRLNLKVYPTMVMTDMGKIGCSDPEKAKSITSRIPLGKFAEVDDVVSAILFLLRYKSAMTNGVMLPVDGGFSGLLKLIMVFHHVVWRSSL
ncbi:L-xylulose reductase [Xyrauchen texanus]|uniref:L-xylulose reductase n=1 Tax=Xyrauchen texanus TaxID=154827 RepID=UPI002242BCD9|nr:L-xylulose reductase [Xyrauchen texanus]